MNKYRFLPLSVPGWYGVFMQDGQTRIPGDVTVSTTLPRTYTYRREMPPLKGKRKPAVVVSITAESVSALSAAIDDYFEKEKAK